MRKGGQSYFLVIYPKGTHKTHLLDDLVTSSSYFDGMSILQNYSRYNKTYFHIFFPKRKQKTLKGLTNKLNSLGWKKYYPGKKVLVEIDSTFRRNAKYRRDLSEIEKTRNELRKLEEQAEILRNKLRELENSEFGASQKKIRLL